MRVVEECNLELQILEDHVRQQARDGEVLRILEAGCGRQWYFDLEGIDFELTGIDLDAEALRARQFERKDLDRAIIGDIRTVALEAEKYDVVYSAYVLEHISGAEAALANLLGSLKPGGLLVLRVPDRDGVHGFLTRLTPHWFHVLYYRLAWRMKDAGKPGFGPYPTVYDPVVSIQGIQDFAANHGLTLLEVIGVGTYERGHGVFRKITPVVASTVSLLCLGRVHAKYVDLAFVLRKCPGGREECRVAAGMS